MRVLGISAFYHDSAAALVDDGQIVAAAQEERFTRIKHDASFPRRAVEYCLSEGGVSLAEVNEIVFYEKPLLKFERLLETYVSFAPRGFTSFRMAIPLWLREKLFQKDLLLKEFRQWAPAVDWSTRLSFTQHHLSHAASAFFPSPFGEAAVVTMDGVGEWATTSIWQGEGDRLTAIEEIRFPHSLGLLYSAFTYYIGFKVNSGEYKVMGLAPYGRPIYADRILENLIDLRPDGSFRMDQSYFDYCTGLTMTNPRFHELFGGPPRSPEEPLEARHMDLAASVQAVTEKAVEGVARRALRLTGSRNLCLAGGVALNCVANGKLLEKGVAERIWIQPAAGDAGGAIGAALAVHYAAGGVRPVTGAGDGMRGSLLGPSFSQAEIESRLAEAGAHFQVVGDEAACLQAVVDALVQGKAVGWFQGRMEFGPRALGARSILGDPRSPGMQRLLNLKVKYRESFRPFAPAVRREDASDWFELDTDSPYMLLVAGVAKHRRRPMTEAEAALFGIDKLNVVRSEIPAVTHVDYSARVQTVTAEGNPLFHSLLTAFKQRTGCPVLVNTSFNVRGEPIVCTPEDAFRCFLGTEIEMLAIGRCILEKEAQAVQPGESHAFAFAPD